MKKIILIVMMLCIVLLGAYWYFFIKPVDIFFSESAWEKYNHNEYSEGTNVEIEGLVTDLFNEKNDQNIYSIFGKVSDTSYYKCEIKSDKQLKDGKFVKIKGEIKNITYINKEGKQISKMIIKANNIEYVN